MPPSSQDEARAKELKEQSKRLKQEAEELWGDVQSNTELKSVQDKVDRLKEVEAMMKDKANEFISLLDTYPELATLFDTSRVEASKPAAKGQASKRKSMFSSCCFADIDNEKDINKRASMACPDRLSRVVMISTDSALFGEVECIIIEPRAKMLAPEEYVTTGVVVCMQGLLPPSKDTIKEWGVVNDVAHWTKMGATVVIPNVQANSALDETDIADIVNGICDYVCFDRVLLVGKDLVAPLLVGLACNEKFDRSVAGVMLLGPTSPPPRIAQQLPCPLFLLWAEDDDVCEFKDHVQWVEMAQEGRLIVVSKWCESGGHDFGKVASQEGVAEKMKNFFVTSVLASDLMESDEVHDGTQKTETRIDQLTQQLPASLRQIVNQEATSGAAGDKKQRMSLKVGEWISRGMRDSDKAQATE